MAPAARGAARLRGAAPTAAAGRPPALPAQHAQVVRMELPKMNEKPRKREAKPAHVLSTSTLKMIRYLAGGGGSGVEAVGGR